MTTYWNLGSILKINCIYISKFWVQNRPKFYFVFLIYIGLKSVPIPALY